MARINLRRGIRHTQLSKVKLLLTILISSLTVYVILSFYNMHKSTELSRVSRRWPRVCKAGKKFQIESVQNLWDNEEHLHCIFHLGWEPQRVPVGPFYGEMINFADSTILNPIGRALWMGKLVTQVNCKENTTAFLGWNYIAGPAAPFVASVGVLNNLINTDKMYRDNKSALVFDCTLDLKAACKEMNEEDKQNYPVNNFSPWKRNFWPLTQITDILRPVGKQADGGIIYLGQLYVVNIYRSDRKSTPVCFFAVVNYDESAVPQLEAGDSLTPFMKDVRYKRYNFARSALYFTPLNFLNEPIHTVKTVVSETWLFLTNGLAFLKDFTWVQFCATKVELKNLMEPPSSLVLPSRSSRRKSSYLFSKNSVHDHELEL